MAERRTAGNLPIGANLRALGTHARLTTLVTLTIAFHLVLTFTDLGGGANTHVHFARLTTFADPDVAPEAGPVRQVLRIAVFTIVLGWLVHRSTSRAGRGARAYFVMIASFWSCFAGVLSTFVWSLGEWFGEASRTLAVTEMGRALDACDKAAFQGLAIGLAASAVAAFGPAARPSAHPGAPPSVVTRTGVFRREWWITPAVGSIWAFTLGSAQYGAWTARLAEHSATPELPDSFWRPTPSSVLFGLLDWPSLVEVDGALPGMRIILLAIPVACCVFIERRLMCSARDDVVVAFFFRWGVVSLFTAFVLCLVAMDSIASEEAVKRQNLVSGVTFGQRIHTTVGLMPQFLQESADQILIKGPLLVAVPALGIALIAHAVHRAYIHPAVCAGLVPAGVITAVVVVPLGMQLVPTPAPWRPPWEKEVCGATAGICDGVRSGDLDGDGLFDHVGITFTPTVHGYRAQREVTISLVTADGFKHSQVLPAPFQGAKMTWLGLADVNGDRRDEVFIRLMAGTRSVEAIALEMRDGRFVPLRGIKDGRIALHSTGVEYAGFTCSDGTRLTFWRVRRTTGKSPVYRGREEVWSSSPGGAFRRLTSRVVEFPADEGAKESVADKIISKNIDARCPGLGPPSWND